MPSLRRNIISLYAVQCAAYVVPLLLLPWLTRILGLEGFGRLSFSIAINAYFMILVDYGFNLTATRQIALHRHDRDSRSEIFWATMAIKAALAVLGLLLLLGLTYGVERLAQERSLLLLGYLVVLGAVLTPNWYFQGTERLQLFSTVTIAIRTLSVAMTFVFVTGRQHLPIAVAIGAGTPVVTGIACLAILLRERAVSFVVPTRERLRTALAEGWHVFLSTASISLYTSTNSVILGFVAGNAAVGQYSAAERLVTAAQGLLGPITQSVYPRISVLMRDSRSEAFALIRKLLRFQAPATLLFSAALSVAAPYVIAILYGPAYHGAIDVLRWLCWLPFVIGLSNVFGIHTMLPLGMQREVSRIVLLAGVVHVFLLFLAVRWLGTTGAGMAVLTTELVVTVLMAAALRRSHIHLFAHLFTKAAAA